MSRANIFRFVKNENSARGTKIEMTKAQADHILDGFELDDSFEEQYGDMIEEVMYFMDEKEAALED